MTPNERILDFLARQPDTIRGHLLARVVLPFIERVSPNDDYAEMVKPIVNPPGGDDKVYRAAMVIGLLDFAFTQERDTSAKHMEESADRMDADNLKRISLGIPLREKHRDRAREEWWRLRGGLLSYAAVWDFYNDVMRRELGRRPPLLSTEPDTPSA